jgi:hypothetical protein
VALRQGRYAGQFTSPEAKELGHWCRQVVGARVIAIDAPCRWGPDGPRDPANGSCYYGWMLQGEALFQDLEPSHPLLTALPITGLGCFETFPDAITLHKRGGHATAANKRAQGSELLEQAGIDLASLTSIDRIDAALCCLAVLLSSPSRRRGKNLPCL